jgi:hypothetical protein
MSCSQEKFDKYSYLWDTNLSSYFKDFARLLDLDKFDMAIQKYVEAQADVAKAQSPCDIGWLRIDITPAKRDISLFATWINLFTFHMCGWIVAILSVDKSMSHMADYGMNWWQA